jgi:GT2 family glycosyltransferase
MSMRDHDPEVSFILPCRDRREILRECLGHLHADPPGVPFETIVFDNASSDGTADMVRADFPDVRLTVLDRNLGAASRNLALREARGRFVVMLDDDSYPVGRSVETALEVLRADGGRTIGCIAFNIRRADGSHETAGIHTAFTGCGAVFPYPVFDRVGGYPRDYTWYVEEYDLSCRIHAAGLRILNFRELEVVHLKSAAQRDYDRIMTQLVRNNLILWTKYLPPEMAREQIETELWRYRRIALKESALPGYERGVAEGLEASARWSWDRSLELDRTGAERMVGRDAIRDAAMRLRASASGRRIVIFNVGKTLHAVLDEVRGRGLRPVAIVDDNAFMQGESFRGVPVVSRERLAEGGFDGILIGSAALSLNDRYQEEILTMGLDVPVVRLCSWDRLEDFRRAAAAESARVPEEAIA